MAQAMLSHKKTFVDSANQLNGFVSEWGTPTEYYAHIKSTATLEPGQDQKRHKMSLKGPILQKTLDLLKGRRTNGEHTVEERGAYKTILSIESASLTLGTKKDGYRTPYASVSVTNIASFKTLLESLKKALQTLALSNGIDGYLGGIKKPRKRPAPSLTRPALKKKKEPTTPEYVPETQPIDLFSDSDDEADGGDEPGTSGTQQIEQ